MPAQTTTTRPLHVILWGATGFVGQLTAERLAEYAQTNPDFRWALAGRNRSKLQNVQAELTKQWPSAADIPLVLGDSADPASLVAMASQTRVVISTVGPYALYGSPLVAACIEAGTDYCDLTGEVQWVAEMIAAHHAAAEAKGVRIVHCCGFDSIPSDMGALLAAEAAIAAWGKPPVSMRMVVIRAKGGFSGGTIASMLNVFDKAASDRALRRLLGDPYSLNPADAKPKAEPRDSLSVSTDPLTGRALAPFVMAAVNTRVVRRSNALLGFAWGRELTYAEWMATGRGLRGQLTAQAMRAGIAGFMGTAAVKPLRQLMQHTILPAPGEGPSRELVEHGSFETQTIAVGPDGQSLQVTMKGKRDPGYGATASMLTASALVLALDRPKDARGGVLTPAVALGRALLPRMARWDVVFSPPQPVTSKSK